MPRRSDILGVCVRGAENKTRSTIKGTGLTILWDCEASSRRGERVLKEMEVLSALRVTVSCFEPWRWRSWLGVAVANWGGP